VSSRRTLILIGALVVGAIAALLIFQYVGSIEDKAQGDAQLVPIVIAAGDIAKGQESNGLIDGGLISVGERRRADLPANAVARVEDIRGQIAALDIAPGTIITSAMFASNADLTDSNSSILREGMVAVTVSTDQVRSVAGLVKPGDYVNIMVSGSCVLGADGKPALGGAEGSSAEGEAAAPLPGTNNATATQCIGQLFQKARILAIGRSFGSPVAAAPADPAIAPSTTEAPTSDMITFEVPADQAQYVAAAGQGLMYFALVRPDYVPVPINPALFPLPLAGAAGLTPYGGDPEAQGDGQ
jgi:Flp pilus assembly protein CpaB